MENQSKEGDVGLETEEIPEEFQCCVCLDLLYKPVVLGCGHLACFWCVFKTMDTWQESHCPVCRHTYHHFPSICQMLHFLLLKLYPSLYERREKQVIEEEKEHGSCSPQFDDYLSESHSKGREPSLVKDISERIVPDKYFKDDSTIPPASSFKAPENEVVQENSTVGNTLVDGSCNAVLVTDMLCAICKQMLCRPVVLNCGHVYCTNCIKNSSESICRCPVCQSVHPYGLPKVCLVLEHFLEEQFSKEYVARKEFVSKQTSFRSDALLTCSGHSEPSAAQGSSNPILDHSSWSSGQGPKVHFAVGCDYCGMCPIIGERYRCKDCVEKIGFDLCEGCYNSTSKLPGRFNQQHRPEHKFEIVQPLFARNFNLILSLDHEDSQEGGFDDPEDQGDLSRATNTSVDAHSDLETGPTAPISSNESSENQEGMDSRT